MNKKNLLFISAYPFPLDMGSKQHAYFMMKALATYFNLICVFFLSENSSRYFNLESDLLKIGVKDFKLLNFNAKEKYGIFKRINEILSFPNSFMNSATYPLACRVIKSLISKHSVEIAFFEHFWFTKHAFYLDKKLKRVVVYHDLHHQVFMQMAKNQKKLSHKFFLLIEGAKLKLYEHMLDKCVSIKIFLNPDEMKKLPKKAIYIPHIVNSSITYKEPRETDFFNIIFIGAYKHPPNKLSLKYIVDLILPKLFLKEKRFKIHVVGPNTEQFRSEVSSSFFQDHIKIHGFLPNLNTAFENMDIALFPILSGGGIKTKIIDAMAAGLPVVTTSKGINGLQDLPNNCIGVADTLELMILEVVKLMRSKSLRSEKSKLGKDFIKNNHSFKAFSEKINQNLNKMID